MSTNEKNGQEFADVIPGYGAEESSSGYKKGKWKKKSKDQIDQEIEARDKALQDSDAQLIGNVFHDMTEENAYPRFLKVGAFGDEGSGKSVTVALIVCGLAWYIYKKTQKMPTLYLIDSDGGSGYLLDIFKIAKVPVKYSVTSDVRVIGGALRYAAKTNNLVMIDQITSPWEVMMDEYSTKVAQRGTLTFGDHGMIKHFWRQEFGEAFRYLPVHAFWTARQGNKFEEIITIDPISQQETKESYNAGIKPKTEGQAAYEPSLVLLMEKKEIRDIPPDELLDLQKRSGDDTGGRNKKVRKPKFGFYNATTCLKDKFGGLTGMSRYFARYVNDGEGGPEPDYVRLLKANEPFNFIWPHVKRLRMDGGSSISVYQTDLSEMFAGGKKESPVTFINRQVQRDSLLEEIKNTLNKHFGMERSEESKQWTIAALEMIFLTSSWTAISNFPLDDLRKQKLALEVLLNSEEGRQKVEARASAARHTAQTKDSKKTKPSEKSANEVKGNNVTIVDPPIDKKTEFVELWMSATPEAREQEYVKLAGNRNGGLEKFKKISAEEQAKLLWLALQAQNTQSTLL